MCVGQAVAGVWPLAQVVSDQSVLRAIVEYSSVYRRYLKADPAALGSGARDTGVGNEAARGAPEPPEAERTRDAAHASRGRVCVWLGTLGVGEINLLLFCRATHGTEQR